MQWIQFFFSFSYVNSIRDNHILKILTFLKLYFQTYYSYCKTYYITERDGVGTLLTVNSQSCHPLPLGWVSLD